MAHKRERERERETETETERDRQTDRQRQTERGRAGGRESLMPLFGWSNCIRGVYFVLKMCFFIHICDPCLRLIQC